MRAGSSLKLPLKDPCTKCHKRIEYWSKIVMHDGGKAHEVCPVPVKEEVHVDEGVARGGQG